MTVSISLVLKDYTADLLPEITKRVSLGIAAIVLAQTVAAFAYRLTECNPVADNFKPPTTPGLQCVTPVEHNHMMVGHAIVGIVIDVALLLLPLYTIYTKMIWSKRTIQVLIVMSVGVFVLITGVLRLYFMLTLNFASDMWVECLQISSCCC